MDDLPKTRLIPHALVKYTCADCGKDIPVGTQYYYIAMKIDGEVNAIRVHTANSWCVVYEDEEAG